MTPFNPKLLIYMVVIKVLRGLLSLSYIIGRTDPCNYLQEVVHTTSTQTNSVESTTSKYNSSLLCVPKRSASTIIAVEVVRPLYSLFFVMLVRVKNINNCTVYFIRKMGAYLFDKHYQIGSRHLPNCYYFGF